MRSGFASFHVEPSTRYLDMAREIVLHRLRAADADVYLFGSWARGDARRTSDIDIAILPRGNLPPRILSDIRERLEAAPIPYPIELVDLRDASPSLRDRVLREGVKWSA